MTQTPALARRAGRVAGFLAGIRGRLTVLLLVAGVPVIFLAVSDAVQRRMTSLEEGTTALRLQRASLAGRLDATLSDFEAIFATVLDDERLHTAGECSPPLRRLLERQSGRLGNLWVLGADGQQLCSALPEGLPSGMPTLRDTARDRGRLVFGPISPASDGQLTALPFAQRGEGGHILAGTLLLSGLLPSGATATAEQQVWLLDRNAGAALLNGRADAPLPPIPRSSLAAAGLQSVTLPQGDSLNFSAASLFGGLSVLVAQPAASARDVAWGTLLRRLVELTVFLVVCLLLILLAMDGALVRPLRRLAARVKRWKPGEAFEPLPQADVPREITELEAAFAQATLLLDAREQALQSAVARGEALMGEIHHRVKNNLQIVSSLLNLQANRISDPMAKNEFRAARNRVRALATLHRHLYLQHSFEAIAVAPFLEELVNGQFTSQGEVAGERVRPILEVDPVSISADQAVSVSLFITEALSNVLNHAFPDGRSGRVWIGFTVQGGEATLSVRDDGIGLTPEARRGRTLGLQFLDSFARQLGGRLVGGEEGEGTAWQVRFPVRDKAEPPRGQQELQRRDAA